MKQLFRNIKYWWVIHIKGKRNKDFSLQTTVDAYEKYQKDQEKLDHIFRLDIEEEIVCSAKKGRTYIFTPSVHSNYYIGNLYEKYIHITDERLDNLKNYLVTLGFQVLECKDMDGFRTLKISWVKDSKIKF